MEKLMTFILNHMPVLFLLAFGGVTYILGCIHGARKTAKLFNDESVVN